MYLCGLGQNLTAKSAVYSDGRLSLFVGDLHRHVPLVLAPFTAGHGARTHAASLQLTQLQLLNVKPG